MELTLRIIFVIYTELLSSTVFASERQIQFKTGNGQSNTNVISCGVRKGENKYVAVKLPLAAENEICHGLEHDWLLGKHYDDGYYYAEKQKVVEKFKPPLSVIQNNYFWELPSSFKAGANLIFYITSPVSWERLEVNLYDSTRDDLAVNPPGSKPIMYHLYFRTDANKAGVDTYTPNGGWHFDGSTVVPSPVQYGKTYNITLESHTGFIRTIIDGIQYFDLPHITPPVNAATMQIYSSTTVPLLVHNITMNGIV